jgi:hypothetical protein
MAVLRRPRGGAAGPPPVSLGLAGTAPYFVTYMSGYGHEVNGAQK